MRKFSKWITIGLCLLAFALTWGILDADWTVLAEVNWASALSTVIVTGGILWGVLLVVFGMVDSL